MSKILPFLAGLLVFNFGALHAGFTPGFDSITREPGVVEVVNMKPAPLVEGKEKNTFLRIPEVLKTGVQVFVDGGKAGGIADFKATKDGWLLIACDYSYQGNASGDWQKGRWTEDDFKSNGWRKLKENELGGILVTIFAKRLKAGESARLRCNKYHPPQFILLPPK